MNVNRKGDEKMHITRIVDGGSDKYGKYIIVEYDNGQQERVYVTGSKVDKTRVENLEEKYPELRKKYQDN